MAVTLALPALPSGCAAPTNGSATSSAVLPQESTTSKVTSFLKSGPEKAAAIFTPKPQPPGAAPPGPVKPTPDLFVSMARWNERSGNVAEAERQYKLALKADPNDLAATMGLAHLHDQKGELDTATKLYQKAAAKHPKEAAVLNDLGLCLHRRGMINEAPASLS